MEFNQHSTVVTVTLKRTTERARVDTIVRGDTAVELDEATDSPLLRLPAELRNRIYKYIFTDRTFQFVDPMWYPPCKVILRHQFPVPGWVGLIQTCRQINTDTAMLPYAYNVFFIDQVRTFNLLITQLAKLHHPIATLRLNIWAYVDLTRSCDLLARLLSTVNTVEVALVMSEYPLEGLGEGNTDEWVASLKSEIQNPRCEVEAPFSKRDSFSLVKREQKYPYDVTTQILLQLLTVSGGGSAMITLMEEAWNSAMGDRFSNLHFPSMREFTQKLHTWTTRGPIELTQQIMCNLNYWNSRASKKDSEKTLICVDMSCDEEDCGDLDSTWPERHSLGTFERLSNGHKRHFHHNHHRHEIQRRTANENSSGHSVLEKRSRDYAVRLVSPSGQLQTITITLPDYNDLSDLKPDQYIKDEVIDYDDVDDCGNPRLGKYSLPKDEDVDTENGRVFEMEHILDGQLIGRFMQDAAAGRLRSGATAIAGPIAISYFVTAQTEPILLGSSSLPGGADPAEEPDLQYVYGRVMECLGSEFNDAYFVALVIQIHQVKTKLMQGNRPMSSKNLKKRAESGTLVDAQYTLGKSGGQSEQFAT